MILLWQVAISRSKDVPERGIPIINNGCVPAFKELTPRIRMVAFDPGAPELVITCIPAT